MPFADLETLDLTEYLARHREDTSLWVFLHIPVTVDDSFIGTLGARMRPYRNLFIQDPDPGKSHEQKLADLMDGFLADLDRQPCRAASGHLPWNYLDPLRAARPDLRVVTFLRAPDERVIADYRYQSSPAHPPHNDFVARFPSLEDYARDPASQETMTTFLWGTDGRPTMEALIDHIRLNFAFVGLIEAYAPSCAAIFTAMGQPGPLPDWTPPEPDPSVSQALRDEIRALNPLDQVAYDYVRTILRRHDLPV